MTHLRAWLADVWSTWLVVCAWAGLCERCRWCGAVLTPATSAARDYSCCLGCAKREIDCDRMPIKLLAGDVLLCPIQPSDCGQRIGNTGRPSSA